jgi:hypothetical protein
MAITVLIKGNRKPSFEKEMQKAMTDIAVWTPFQKIAFRIAFIFFVLMVFPSEPVWWQRLFTLDWLHPNYRDIYNIARFLPDMPFMKHYSKGLKSYNDWFVMLGISLAGGLLWTLVDRKRKEYNLLYYWLRVIVRYRAGIGMVGFGMQKISPVQMAYPPISILNTALGDMTMQKLYWWEIGISPFYQSFTGFVELGSGVLLFYRKTVFWGAALLLGALGAVNYVNVAYDGNVHVYSTYFVVFALFLMLYYVKDIYNLQFRERYTVPRHYYPAFRSRGWKIVRAGLKALNIILFLVLLPYLQYLNFIYDPYNQPSARGVTGLRGYYRVTEFSINGRVIPYSPLDSVRWQHAVFEKWSTLSFKVNLPIPENISGRMKDPTVRGFVANNGFDFNSGAPVRDIDRTYEIFAANQRSFYYRADTVNHLLYLQDKATYRKAGKELRGLSADPRNAIYRVDWIPDSSKRNMVGEIEAIPEAGRSARRRRAYEQGSPLDQFRDRMILRYEILRDGKRVLLSGINERSDSICVLLDRVDKPYLLPETKFAGGQY